MAPCFDKKETALQQVVSSNGTRCHVLERNRLARLDVIKTDIYSNVVDDDPHQRYLGCDEHYTAHRRTTCHSTSTNDSRSTQLVIQVQDTIVVDWHSTLLRIHTYNNNVNV